MIATAAFALVFLAIPGGGPEGRLLLCRPTVTGDARWANAGAVPVAARALAGRLLDYGVSCDDIPEAVRAARRAGLEHVLSSSAEGRLEGASYVLTLSNVSTEKDVARRDVVVATGEDAIPPLERALRELVTSTERTQAKPVRKQVAPWIVAGVGAAALAASGAFALLAGSSASDRDRAGRANDYKAYVERDAAWRRWSTASGVALGVGGAALAAGLVWRFAL